MFDLQTFGSKWQNLTKPGKKSDATFLQSNSLITIASTKKFITNYIDVILLHLHRRLTFWLVTEK